MKNYKNLEVGEILVTGIDLTKTRKLKMMKFW